MVLLFSSRLLGYRIGILEADWVTAVERTYQTLETTSLGYDTSKSGTAKSGFDGVPKSRESLLVEVYSNEAAKLQGLMILTCVCIPKCTICWVLGQGSGTGLEVCAEACPASTPPMQAHLARAPGTAGSA